MLFLDIEGYTRLSEDLPRQTLNAVVERYFSLFLAPIRAEGGDINETAGDGLMIIFQDGESDAHAAAAVRAALAIREQTAQANRDPGRRHPPIVVNIGISSGECDVGTTRFEGLVGERWTFTASGPVTNLAARLGSRATGGQILLAPETARGARPLPRPDLGLVSLKNLSSPVEVWEVEGERHAVADPSTADGILVNVRAMIDRNTLRGFGARLSAPTTCTGMAASRPMPSNPFWSSHSTRIDRIAAPATISRRSIFHQSATAAAAARPTVFQSTSDARPNSTSTDKSRAMKAARTPWIIHRTARSRLIRS